MNRKLQDRIASLEKRFRAEGEDPRVKNWRQRVIERCFKLYPESLELVKYLFRLPEDDPVRVEARRQLDDFLIKTVTGDDDLRLEAEMLFAGNRQTAGIAFE